MFNICTDTKGMLLLTNTILRYIFTHTKDKYHFDLLKPICRNVNATLAYIGSAHKNCGRFVNKGSDLRAEYG